ncbi:MAG: hypothetical protein JWR80_9912 [Bradyrhizobium sp.]|nr:hypothetical protein [Bradyrhizobium sp.]
MAEIFQTLAYKPPSETSPHEVTLSRADGSVVVLGFNTRSEAKRFIEAILSEHQPGA